MRFGVVFLTQKSPSTSWIVTYHVFRIAGFAFPDILNDWLLSISLCYEHFSHDTGVTACPLFEAVIESWQQLIPKQAMTQLVTPSCNLVTQKIQTTQKTMHKLQKWATLSKTVTRYILSQTLMSNASQYIASKGFRYIYYICRWWLKGGFVIIFGRFRGGQS